MGVTEDGTAGNDSGFAAPEMPAPNVTAPDVTAPEMPARNGVHLDLYSSNVGWCFQLTGGTYSTGWRPNRAWAKRAGRRQMRAFKRRR